MRLLALLIGLVMVTGPALAQPAGPCAPEAGGGPPAVARLRTATGDVRLDGVPIEHALLPELPICAGSRLALGPDSRAAVRLLEASSDLRFDAGSIVTFDSPPAAGSGLIGLLEGALYMLSRVPRRFEVRTGFVTAGIEGTEVYVRTRDGGGELIVLEGRVAAAPPTGRAWLGPARQLATGDRLVVADGTPAVSRVGAPGGVYAPMRLVTADALAWTLFYPDILTEEEAASPSLREAARSLAAGQVAAAEAQLASISDGTPDAGTRDALRAVIAIGRRDLDAARRLAESARRVAPNAAAPLLALSYVRQLDLDLDGALASAEAASQAAPRSSLAQARLAELRLTRGETRAARRAAEASGRLGTTPLTDIVRGYAALAGYDARTAEALFRRALVAETQNPLALLGLGLARIRRGALEDGRSFLESAVAHDPASAILRSYLGKAYFEERRDEVAGLQLDIGKELDPADPTPWYYDAIRKQLDNRPVEALRDLERSIALNDNRAPYRSRLLLDQDLATRGVSLARIYDDLGFTQLGINEAAKSLTIDPSNAAAHRFLADLYQGEPRLEVARVSELLQSQLLQPVGLNPVQPSLAFSDLDIVRRSGPANVGFNEYTRLFEKDGFQVNASGIVGTDQTRGEEVALTGLVGRTGFSVGQFHYETDGFRNNNDLEHDIVDVFGQTQVTDWLNLQAEYRRRDTFSGDRAIFFDPNVFDETFHESIEEEIFRVGGRISPDPNSNLLISAIYADREDRFNFEVLPSVEQADESRDNIGEVKSQYLVNIGPARVTLGAGRAVSDGRGIQESESPSSRLGTDAEITASDAYAIANVTVSPSLTVALRFGYDDVDLDDQSDVTDTSMSGFTPGIAAIWQPGPGTLVRAAFGRTIKRPFVANQTLRPTQLGGFNHQFDDFDGTRADQLDLSFTQLLAPDVAVGAHVTRRRLARELVPSEGQTNNLDDQRDDRLLTFLYWTLNSHLAVSFAPSVEVYQRKERDTVGGDPLRIDTVSIPLTVNYFAQSGFFAAARATFLSQQVEKIENETQIREDDTGILLDLTAGLRIPQRRGLLAFEIENVFDQRLKFQDETFRSSTEEVNPRFIPSRTFLLSLNLSF